MFAVDTNVLLYAAHAGFEEHRACRGLVERWRADPAPWVSTWSVLYEFLRVATHPRVLNRPAAQAWQFIEALLEAPGFRILSHTEHHARVAAQTFAEVRQLRGNLVHDAHIAILMREHGVRRIYTRDTAFHRFKFIEVVDPLEEEG